MPDALSIALIVTANLLLGWLIFIRFSPGDGDGLEILFASFTLGLAVNGTFGLLLAQFALFSITHLALLWLTLLLILSLTLRHSPLATRFALPRSLAPRLEYPLLVIWLLATLWLFFRPHEFILGAADAGVYVNLGAEIAQHGSILIQDETWAAVDPALRPVFLRPLPDNPAANAYLFPAFFVTGTVNGQITPQFYPLHPVWLAIAYGLGGSPSNGVQTALLLTGLWGLLGGLAVYLTVRQAMGWPTAVLALLGLSLNALQIWFARYPVTEAFAQYLLWAGLWSAGAWLSGRPNGRLWALLAGITLGQLFLLRIDTLFIVPVLALLWLWLWAQGKGQPAQPWFFAPLAAHIVYSLIHAYWQSRPYFVSVFGYGLLLLRVYWFMPLAGLLLGAAVLLILRRFRHHLERLRRYERPFLATATALVVLTGLYLWLVRPIWGQPVVYLDPYSQTEIVRPDHENLWRLGWYLSPLGIGLGLAGIGWLVGHTERKTAVMLAICLTFSLIYLWNIQNTPHQIYVMRRYLPATLPLFIVGAAALLGWLARQSWRGAPPLAGLLALLWLGGLGWSARGFVSQIDHRGLIAQVDGLNQQLAPEAILLVNDQALVGVGDFIGTPLRFMYGHPVFSLRNLVLLEPAQLAKTIESWQNSGRTVYWVGDPTWLTEQRLAFQPSFTVEINTLQLEGPHDRKPTAVISNHWTLDIRQLK